MTDSSSSSSPSSTVAVPTEADILREENQHLTTKYRLLAEFHAAQHNRSIATLQMIIAKNLLTIETADMRGDIQTVETLAAVNGALVRAIKEIEAP